MSNRITIAVVALILIGGALYVFAPKQSNQPLAPVAEQTATTTAQSRDENAPVAVTAPVDAEVIAAEEATEETTLAENESPETTDLETSATAGDEFPPAPAPEAPAADAAPAVSQESAVVLSDESLLSAPSALDIDVPLIMKDRVLGNPAAPVTIIEYASMTCPHCAHFANNILPTVKQQLVETGKAKLIFREFPLDQFAMKASMLARCAPMDKYYDFLEVLFRNQDRWVKSEDPLKALKQLGQLAGMEDAYMDNCMSNVELENVILARVKEAQTLYKINSTPTFVFNNGIEKLTGGATAQDFANTVNKLTPGN